MRQKKLQKKYQQEMLHVTATSQETLYALEVETNVDDNLYQSLQTLPPRMGTVFRMFYLQRK